ELPTSAATAFVSRHLRAGASGAAVERRAVVAVVVATNKSCPTAHAFNVEPQAQPAGWHAIVSPSSLLVPPGRSRTVHLLVTAPANARAGARVSVPVVVEEHEALPIGQGALGEPETSIAGEVQVGVNVAAPASVGLTCPRSSRRGAPLRVSGAVRPRHVNRPVD